jgi:hypothetical protein
MPHLIFRLCQFCIGFEAASARFDQDKARLSIGSAW